MSLVIAKGVGPAFFVVENLRDAIAVFADTLSLLTFARAATDVASPCSSSVL